mmetsp:Transcript_51212/g.169654  ORF Transcript_51212/g.169654 Transcript_51212/m.169654 type:complete len:295 (+) Transcript_51212:1056-1940(+)
MGRRPLLNGPPPRDARELRGGPAPRRRRRGGALLLLPHGRVCSRHRPAGGGSSSVGRRPAGVRAGRHARRGRPAAAAAVGWRLVQAGDGAAQPLRRPLPLALLRRGRLPRRVARARPHRETRTGRQRRGGRGVGGRRGRRRRCGRDEAAAQGVPQVRAAPPGRPRGAPSRVELAGVALCHSADQAALRRWRVPRLPRVPARVPDATSRLPHVHAERPVRARRAALPKHERLPSGDMEPWLVRRDAAGRAAVLHAQRGVGSHRLAQGDRGREGAVGGAVGGFQCAQSALATAVRE